ncbi:MAG TPA: hypothetical protein VH331_02055 [Allosphingosinicella sp.]|jgi:hypothetical protein|nr:hypothetical protein [Allosphingosinicella sp.]
MPNKQLLGAAAAAIIAFIPASAWAQGADANTTTAATNSANAVPNAAPANLVMGNSAAAGPAAPAATDPNAGGDTNAPRPVYMVQRGFPWGILGVIGLIGLLPLFRRRDG